MEVKEILRQYWGYHEFRPLQEEIINSVLQKQDTLALLPTGGGKSICFQVPAMAMEGICIVISPLIALMKDQVENLHKRGISAIAIFAGMGKREIDIALDNCIYGPVKFLYLSPERLLSDLVKERIKYMKVNLLAVDEAHCISQWGYDFRPPYMHIIEFRNLHPKVPILALTASATEKVQLDIIEKLGFKNQNIYRKSFERKNLIYAVINQENKLQKLIDVCNGVKGSGILYVRTRKDTVELAKYLNQHGIAAQYYHAGLNLDERSEKQQFWLEDKVRLMVATNAFGMGIDKSNVRFVVHYEMPESLESYYQEAGRAGRDEKKAYAVVLYQARDKFSFERKFEQNFPEPNLIKKTYHFICNYLQIPIDTGEQVTYEFNLADFCSKFQLEVQLTISAIKFLEHDEYLVLSENALIPSRIQFIVNGEDLYKFQVENSKFDSFIKAILRSYGGAFDGFVHIKERDISQKTNLTQFEVKAFLREMDKLEVISYIEQSNQPLLTFLRPRIKTEDITIDRKYYENRKQIYKEKMVSMLAFVEKPLCRSRQLLNYFDEANAEKCGVCDVCLAEKRAKKPDLKSQITNDILTALQFAPLKLNDLVKCLKKGSDKEKLEIIRLLLDAREIKKNEGYFQLN
ncbi:MAG: RecQ family ATP-dependent DNA helicase [Bacteroidetes bacterium]|nr:RecQ family ATP-dependent DNA helicase [Bacteroidota bacterium]MBU1485877.1 RecQ family ATP-dependent DNA helicase [Bacteroidota bacterium]MBU2268044.1 RecQ family ATP-dependent DNA helicase [Bacteroidota bacterium]MBU2376596.1 RecQ family ATP-dependent DNA helicase [Bacteroidota bacterium]